MKPRSAKAKGSEFERKISKELEEVLGEYGVKATRQPMSGAIDRFKGDIHTNLPVSFELKKVEKLDFRGAWKQCKESSEGKMPILITSRNHDKNPLCLLEFSDLLFFMELALQAGWVSGMGKKKKK